LRPLTSLPPPGLRCGAALLPVLLALSGASWAQAPAGQAVQKEIDVTRADGGYWIQPGQGPQPGSGQLVPPELVTPSPAEYPEALRAEPVVGSVELELLIDERGAVQETRVLRSLHPLLDAAAETAARKLQFKPATVDGAALAVRLHFTYEFTRPPERPAQAVAHLKGQVRSKGTRRPVTGATLLFGAGLPPVQTDVAGRFEADVPPGALTVQVSSPDHKKAEFRETLQANQALEVVYALEPLRVNPYETVVRGERERTEVSRVTLREQELREVPGTMGDPFRVVMLLPGVASVASGVSYPVVRGSQPAATGYFLDGVRVPSLYHLVVGTAVIHPDFIEAVDFYPGPAPVPYGRLMGGAVEGHISRPREDRVHVTAYADLINAGGFVEAPIPQTGTSVTLAGRLSYTPWLIARLVSLVPMGQFQTTPIADFYDYQARIEQRIGDGRLRLFVFGSSDVTGVDTDDPLGVDVHLFSIFHRFDLRYRQPLGPGEAEVGVTYGIQRIGLTGERNQEYVGAYELREGNVSARASWTMPLGKQAQLTVGADAESRRSVTEIFGSDRTAIPTLLPPLTRTTFVGAHAQLVWHPTPQWTVVPGLRFDSYYLVPRIQHLSLEPRLTGRFELTDRLTLKGGAGLVRQPPTVLLNLPVLDTAGLRYGLQAGLQLDAGAEWRPRDGLEVNADVYYNPVMRAVELDIAQVLADRRRFTIAGYDPGVRGRAYGIELMVRHPIGDSWFGWISYTFQRAERLQRFSRFADGNLITESVVGYVPFAFEQTHVFNAALSYKFASNLTAGVVVHFNTGRPESGQVTSRAFHPGTGTDGNPVWVYDDRDRVAQLPPFFRVDARISKSWAFDNFILEAYLDVMNATVSREILGYTYGYEFLPPDETPSLVKQPIEIPIVLPILGIKGTY
jgi:TonB family protein